MVIRRSLTRQIYRSRTVRTRCLLRCGATSATRAARRRSSRTSSSAPSSWPRLSFSWELDPSAASTSTCRALVQKAIVLAHQRSMLYKSEQPPLSYFLTLNMTYAVICALEILTIQSLYLVNVRLQAKTAPGSNISTIMPLIATIRASLQLEFYQQVIYFSIAINFLSGLSGF